MISLSIFIFWYSAKYLGNINHWPNALFMAEFLTVANTLHIVREILKYIMIFIWAEDCHLCLVFQKLTLQSFLKKDRITWDLFKKYFLMKLLQFFKVFLSFLKLTLFIWRIEPLIFLKIFFLICILSMTFLQIQFVFWGFD